MSLLFMCDEEKNDLRNDKRTSSNSKIVEMKLEIVIKLIESFL